MSIDEVREAMDALAAEGQAVTARNVRQRIGRGSPRDITQHMRAIKQERQGEAEAETGAVAVAEEDLPDPVPQTTPEEAAALARVAAAESALAAARQHLATLERELAPALKQRVMLVTGQRMGVITREDPAWREFDDACAQIHAATKQVEQAEQDVKYAHQAHDTWLYEQVAAVVRQTPEGQAVLAKIAEYERLLEEAHAKESTQTGSWSMALAWARKEFRNLVNIHRGLMQAPVTVSEEQRQQDLVGAAERLQQANPARDPVRYNAFR